VIKDPDIEELRALCPEARAYSEAGIDYVLLPSLRLPLGSTPPAMDCLLCMGARDGYENRLFFATIVSAPTARNWNTQNVRILERNWFAYSWRVPNGMRPIEVLINHLGALRC
jgi:hypothetical protein